jgi:hypothetical protein
MQEPGLTVVVVPPRGSVWLGMTVAKVSHPLGGQDTRAVMRLILLWQVSMDILAVAVPELTLMAVMLMEERLETVVAEDSRQ